MQREAEKGDATAVKLLRQGKGRYWKNKLEEERNKMLEERKVLEKWKQEREKWKKDDQEFASYQRKMWL